MLVSPVRKSNINGLLLDESWAGGRDMGLWSDSAPFPAGDGRVKTMADMNTRPFSIAPILSVP